MKRLIHVLLPCILLLAFNRSEAMADGVSLNVTSQNITCYGLNNGSITIQVLTGTGNYDFRLYRNNWPWDGGVRVDSLLNTSQSTHTFSNLGVAQYFIIVEDVHSDPGFGTANITQPDVLQITSISIYKGISCSDACDGELLAHVTGGTKPYTYVWSKIPGGVLPDADSIAENLCQGVYKCEINDANNCGSPVMPSRSFPFVESNPFARDSIADPLAGGTIGTTQTICYNSDVPAFTSSAPASGGSGNLVYTWQYSTTSSIAGSGVWTDIPSSNSTTWDYGTLTQTTYFVRRAVDALCGTVYSNVVTITVYPLLTAGTIAGDQTICYNDDVAAFTSSAPAAGGSGSITYTWQYSTTSSTPGSGTWTDIPSSNAAAWDYGTLTQTTYFVRKATDAVCGTVWSNVITITVRPQLTGGTIAGDQTICYNSDAAAFSSTAAAGGGSGSITYTWQYSTTSSTPGSGTWTDIPSSNSLTWDYGTLTQTTYFVRRAVDPVCGTVWSNVITITVRPQLIGGTVAGDQTICYNNDVAAFTSSVPASGGSGTIVYTWQYSTTSSTPGSGTWTDIPSSNSLTWDYGTLTQTTWFVRKATDAICGTVYSNVITVTVNPQLTGGTVGSNQTICYNNDVAAFTSSAPAGGGSGSLTYTWQYSTTSSTPGSGSWTDIPSSNSLTWDYGTLTQTTYFVRRAVDPVCGTVWSNVITITVNPQLTGGTIASNQTICYNNDVAAFTSPVPAGGGSGSLTYTWQYSTTSSTPGSGTWTDIPSSDSPTWDYGTLTQTTYFVRRVVDPSCGTVWSNVVTVTVRPQLIGGTVASDQTICYNDDVAAFTSSAPASGGSGSPTYTWQYSTTSSTPGSGVWTDIPSSDSPTWDYGTLTQTTYFVRRAVDPVCGTVWSNVITVTVRPQLTGGTIASNQTICYNNDVAAFTSSAPASGGSGSPTYTWQYSTTSSTPGSGSWTNIPASNALTWDYGTLTQTTYFVRRAVDPVCGTVYSNVITVTVRPILTGGTIASNQTICYNNDVAAFTSSAPASGGSGSPTYTWQYSTTSSTPGSGVWTDIPSSNSPTWDYGTLTETTYFVRKAVDASCGTVYSNVVTVTVYPQLVGGSVAGDQTLCFGSDAAAFTSTVPASGGSGTITYTWQYSTTSSTPGSGTWNDIPSSDFLTWDYGTLTETTWFVRKAEDAVCGTVYSNAITVTVYPEFLGGSVASDQTLCFGNDVAAFTSASPASGGSGTITYTWQYSTTSSTPGTGTWNDIPGSDSQTWDYGTLTETTYFVRKAEDAVCGVLYSNVITVTVNPLFTGGTIASDQMLCAGSDAAPFTSPAPAGGGSGSLTYTWQYSTTSSTAGSGTWTDIPGSDSETWDYGTLTETTYFVRKAVDINCGTAYSNVVTVTVDLPPEAYAGEDETVCYTTPAYQIPGATANHSMVYQWTTPDGSGSFNMDYVIDPVYVIGTGDLNIGKGGDIRFVLSAVGMGACSGITATDTMVLTIAPELVASVGAPTPFYIGPNTKMEVHIEIEDRYTTNDLGFYLISPDDSVVILKLSDSPLSYCSWSDQADVIFRNNPLPADTISSCSVPLTGVFRATGDWTRLYGQDPANGVWKVVILDYADFPVQETEGKLTNASISFTDTIADGSDVTLYYDMAGGSIDILNAQNAGVPVGTDYIVSLGLRTSCYESCDATAIVTPVGGIGPYSIQWSDGLGTGDVVDLCAGTYYVVVTDALGCTDTAQVVVTSPPPILIEDVQHTDTILCNGDPSGLIRTKATGGTGALTYTLLPGDLPSAVADSGVFLNLTAGTYTIVIRDASGCFKDTTITIQERPALGVQIDVVNVVGSQLGSITLTASGGTPPYQYSVDNGASLQADGLFEDLPVGTYEIYVEDANGCLFLDEVDIVVNELDVFRAQQDVSCFGLADGSFTLSALNGISPYTMTGSFLGDPLVSTDGLFSFTGQPAGDYDLRIVDDEGRTYIDTIRLAQPPAILVSASITNASCTAFSFDGAVDLDVSGGAGGFTFLWSNGASTEDLSGIEAGHYEATVTDANNCQTVYPVDVMGISGANAYAGEDDMVCPGAEYQLFGSAGDSVRWSPSGFVDDPTITDPMATIQNRTEFILTVYQDGCMDSDTVVIDAYERIGMDIYDPSGVVDIDTALFLLEGETYTMAATPGFVSYQWVPGTYLDDPAAQSVVVSPASNILYNVFGTTADGCIESDAVRVVFASRIAMFSGFSPNGDGINDTWVIQHAVEYGERIHVQVFNRWGERVFDSKGYGGSNEFDGTRNGKELPVGAYYYIIDVGDGESEPYTGTVTLIR